MLKSKEDVIDIIQSDDKMMEIIHTASTLDLPDWWICAGFVRSKIWDTLHGFVERTLTPDVDVIYFDPSNLDEDYEKALEKKLAALLPGIPWSVKNQARMHVVNQIPPYTSSEDAISKFPETATALGVKLDSENQLVLTAPCGIEDVLNLEVKPTPFFTETSERVAIYEQRLVKKNWKDIWPMVKVHN
ncbi:nucleotidyltransferase family protein [Bacillus sp. ISL-35]|uniref:nucleotidyltransferase family protein n=1 Tax=Bacillus sp. ISL-35 TaxID=2819122 RepID=UPI001BEA47F2|nr:nucleotidyltransferase family protein [Bacillus sp. ISL-35]MBT2679338.1 nucleotidyltransferase family protein [Bacillus sp. ISL-35]MBT2703237.1 nucleotidyltransferase family protein [Chryseobacterium sp. ISL-80]